MVSSEYFYYNLFLFLVRQVYRRLFFRIGREETIRVFKEGSEGAIIFVN